MENAVEYTTFSLGKFTGQAYQGSYSVDGNYWRLDVTNADYSIWRYCSVDLTSFSKITVISYKSGNATNYAGLAVSKTLTNPHSSMLANVGLSATSDTTYVLDISSIIGQCYIGIGVTTNASTASTTIRCKKILLEA